MYDDEEHQQNSERSYNPDEIGSDPSITLGLFCLCFLFFRFGMAKLLLTFLIFCLFNFFLLLWKLGKNVWFFIKFSQKSHKKVNKKTKFFVQKSVYEPKKSERKIFTYSPRVLNDYLDEVRHDFDESANRGYEGCHDFDESANRVYEGRHDFDEFTNWPYDGRHDFDEFANLVSEGRHNFDEFANLGVLNDCQYEGRHDIDESANFLRDDGFGIGHGIDKFSCDDNIGFGIGDLSENVRGPNDLIRLPQCLSDPALKLPTVTTAQGSAEEERYEKIINPSTEISSSPQCIEIPQLAGPALQPDAFPNVGKIMQVDSSEQESSVRFDAANIGGNVVSANKNCTTTCSQKKITFTELVPLIGLTREAAAEKIGVSIPTFKRLCRVYGIFRWPHYRNKKLCRSLQQLCRSLQQKLAADSDQGAAGAFGHFVTGSHTGAIGSNHHNSPCSKPAKRQREKKTSPSCKTPSTVATCSDPAPAPMQAMSTFPQIMPHLRAGQDARIEISKTTDDILIQSVEGVTTRSCLSPQKRAGSDVPSTSSPKHFHGEFVSTQGSQVCADSVLDYTTQFTTEQVFKSKDELPCAHKIADYIRQDHPIPLAIIHSQWGQLHISICNKEEEKEVTCHAEVELFVKKFNESDRTTRLELLKKLKEIVCPRSTFLVEPEVKPKTCPQDHKKINVSTRRDLCAFDLVQSGHDSFSPRDTQITTLASTLETKGKEKVNAKGKVYITRTVKPGAYVDAFPSGLKPYIKFVKDVAADGNCGFRAIAASISHTEDYWAQVRRDLLGELHTHKEEYITLYGSYERFEELTSILSYFEDSPGYSHWMTMPDMGHLVASCYNLVLYHLSLQQCLTFLPLRTVPVPQLGRREIAIGFVNENHFVQVFLQPGHPVPPIATNWRKYRHPCAFNWDDAYVRRIQHFKDIIHDTVATQETFDVVDVA